MVHISSDQISQMRTTLEKAQEVVIATAAKPTIDSMAASLSLYLALSSVGKHVSIVCPDAPTVELNRLVGIDKVGSAISTSNGRNLIISFPYQEGSIEKVSYNIENDTFNLVIEPREGYSSITPEMMKYSSGGGNVDVVITVSAPQLTDLGSVYQNNQGLFSEKPIVNIDTHTQNTRYGKVNIVDTTPSSVCELLVSLLSHIGFSIDSDIATNLFAGMVSNTQNFTSHATSAETFEAAAICLKSGAQKSLFTPPSPVPDASGIPFPRTQKPAFPQGTTFKPKPFAPPQPPKQAQQDTPPDWLKPKIYKGSTLL